MALEEYRRKRDFGKTPEPPGAEGRPRAGKLSFVVHKHAASHLHYDLRLQVDGVLASWAVPKGPSLDPADRRLAVHVEDHPLEYGTFEGIIPEGEYGAGTVMVWDRGTYEPVDEPGRGIAEGHLKFELHGEKLHGQWALVRMKPREGERRENWLLVKDRDEHVRQGFDVAIAEPLSAASGRTMDEIASEGRVYTGGDVGDAKSPEQAAGRGAAPPAGRKTARTVRRAGSGGAKPARPERESPSPPSGARRAPMPADAPFQLATLVKEAPSGPSWIHEVKYDGYRLRIVVSDGSVRMLSRRGQDWTERFPSVVDAAGRLPATSALIDGEAIVYDAEGRSDFSLLQQALGSGSGGDISFAAFDLLYLDGYDLRKEPLLARKELLRSLIEAASEAAGALRYVEHWEGEGPEFHSSACRFLLEGSVSKKADRPWQPGRGRDWQKAKCLERQEFVIVGYTDPGGSRSGLGSLMLGTREKAAGPLRYAGKVGTGFNEATLRILRQRLEAMETREPAVVSPPRARGLHWVRPELVAEVSFREWTREGHIRHPSFQGLREDKGPAEVVRERAEPPAAGEGDGKPAGRRKAASPRREPASPTEVRPGEALVAGVRITNPEKVLDPAGISKRDLALYYERVADVMLPHLAGRLITAVRCPHGSTGGREGQGCFYQKHPEPRGWPKALRSRTVRDKEGPADYFYAEDEAGLLSLAQMGCLEIHVWNSLQNDAERPDRIVFDLDPGEGLGFGDVADAARVVRGALQALGLTGWPKTTGGHGIHVVAPIRVAHDYEVIRAFARGLCERIAQSDPDRYTVKMAKKLRPNRVYIDYLRNAHGATAVCAFSTRAKPGAPVSVPVRWEELGGLDPARFDTDTVPRRIASLGSDPWSGYEDSRAPVTKEALAAVGVSAPR